MCSACSQDYNCNAFSKMKLFYLFIQYILQILPDIKCMYYLLRLRNVE